MFLIEKIEMICQRKGITIYRLEKELNMSRNTIKKWDKVTPTCKALTLVADYFDVSIDFLLGRTQYELSHKGTISVAGAKILKKVEELQISEKEADIWIQVIPIVVEGYKTI